MATDWTAVRLAYVTGTKTLREVADEFGIKSAGVMRRAAKEGWEAERKQQSATVSKAAQDRIADQRTDELARLNEDDLRLSRALRAQIAKSITAATAAGAPLSPPELRALAGAHESAQRVARLALGASTESSELTGKDGGPISHSIEVAFVGSKG